jgi:uncharacterized protein (DUF433 family)
MNLPEFLAMDPDGSVRILDHRIGLEHLVHDYNEGLSAKSLAEEYPSLSLSLVHKVISFYLDNRADVDRYVAECWAECDRQRSSASNSPSLEELRRRQPAIA